MAEDSSIRILKVIWRKLKAFFTSKNVLSFLFFLFLSFCFWFANALNKERETNINIPVRYIGLPQDIVITNNPANTVSVTIAEEGLRLFSYRRNNITPLLLDVNKNLDDKGRVLIDREQIYNRLSSKLLPTTSVLKINPDSIVLEFQKLHTKILPIELVADLKTASQYYIANDIRIIPDSVAVSGTYNLISNLTSVKTKAVILDRLDKNMSFKYMLEMHDSARYSVDEVTIEIDVDRFTEKHIKLPVTLINVPENIQIRTFPTIVEVTYNVGMSNFNSINEDDIKLVLDYQSLVKDDNGRKKLELRTETKDIFNIRINPEEVEFLLEKN